MLFSHNFPLFILPTQSSSNFLQLPVSPYMSTKHLPNPAHQSPHSANTCIPERQFLMADVHLLEKLNMGEVGDGDEEIKGALHENVH